MVNVTIRRLRAGLTGASSLVLLGQADAGCAAPADVSEGAGRVGETISAAAAVDPGSGTLTLSPRYTVDGRLRFAFDVQNTTDEFVRVGEAIALDVQGYYLWNALHPEGAPFPDDVATLEALGATFEIQFIARGNVVGRASAKVTTWSGEQSWNVQGTTAPVVIPAKTDTLEVGLTIVDPATDARVELADLDFDTVPVFGGELPLKHVLFDNDGATLRQRVIEGGGLVAGGSVALTYADWRADEIVDKLMLNREIGTARSYSRFGPIVTPIYGDVAYEISYGWSYDGQSFSEYPLAATTTSRVLGSSGRTAYEATLYVPTSGSTDLKLYFHVKAFLAVDYTRYGQNVLTKTYNQGDRILLRERWDNPEGKSYANYDVPIEAAP